MSCKAPKGSPNWGWLRRRPSSKFALRHCAVLSATYPIQEKLLRTSRSSGPIKAAGMETVEQNLEPQRPNPQSEIDKLRLRLEEAEEILAAIRSGGVDALVVTGREGERVFVLKGADHAYRRSEE